MIEKFETPSPLSLTQLHVEPTVDPLQDFLFNTPRTTIKGLKDSQQFFYHKHFIITTFKKKN